MGTLTIRIPDEKHQRLKELARQRNMSLNKLIDELSTVTLAQFDSETRFQVLAARESVDRGLEVLDRLDQELTRQGSTPVRHTSPYSSVPTHRNTSSRSQSQS